MPGDGVARRTSLVRRRFDEYLAAGGVPGLLGALGLLMVALSLVAPWYAVDNSVAGGHSPLVEYSLTEKARHDADGTTHLFPYEVPSCRCATVGELFSLTQALIWTGALVAAAAFWGRSNAPRLPRTGLVALTASAGLLAVAAPLVLALSLPGAFLADGERVSNIVPIGRWGAGFIGSHVENVIQTTVWGPSAGWVLALLGGALTLASLRRTGGPVPAEAAAPTTHVRSTASPISAPPAAPMPSESARSASAAAERPAPPG